PCPRDRLRGGAGSRQDSPVPAPYRTQRTYRERAKAAVPAGHAGGVGDGRITQGEFFHIGLPANVEFFHERVGRFGQQSLRGGGGSDEDFYLKSCLPTTAPQVLAIPKGRELWFCDQGY